MSSQLDAHMDFVKLTDEQKQTLLSVKWVRDEVDKMQAKAARSPSQLCSTIMKQEPEADTDDVMLLDYVETKVYRVSGRVECNQGRRCFKRSSETMNYRAGWFDFGELPYYVQNDIDKEGYKTLVLHDFSDEEEQDEDQQLSLYQLVLIKTQD